MGFLTAMDAPCSCDATGGLGRVKAPSIENIRKNNVTKGNGCLFRTFEYVRGWRGELTFECNIGRLIYLDVGGSIVKRDIEWKQWDTFMLSPEGNLRSHFTRILTTQHEDMEFFKQLKVPGGEFMFEQIPHRRRVFFPPR